MRRFLGMLMLVIFSSSAFGLALTGDSLKNTLTFEPGKEYSYSYKFTNAQPYSADYDIFAEKTYGGDFHHFFEITPSRFTNVEPGGSREFDVKVKFPQSADYAGFSEYRVWVKETIDTGGSIMAVPAVGIRYIMFVLYPYKYLQVGFAPENMNEGEKTEFKVSLSNLGTPTISRISGNIEVYDPGNARLAQLQTTNVLDLVSNKGSVLTARYDSSKLSPGVYKANATVDWDGNITVVQGEFRVGELKVDIYRYTQEFVADAINRMDIYVESNWNSKISGLSVEVTVYDGEDQVANFRSFPADIEPFDKKLLESYFDTSGLRLGNYTAKLVASYEGRTSQVTGTIVIKDQIERPQLVEEVPKQGTFSIRSLFGSPFLIIAILVISAGINIFFLLKKEKKKTIDDEIVENVRNLLKTYNKEYLKKTLVEKGWSEEQISEIFRKLK